MNYKTFYEKTYEYLANKAGEHNVDAAELKKYLNPTTVNIPIFYMYDENSMNNLFVRLSFHAQNVGTSKSAIIKFPKDDSQARMKIFKKIFCDFSPMSFLEKYSNVDAFFDVFTRELGIPRVSSKSKTNNEKRSVSYQYCRSVCSVAKFLSSFASVNEFEDQIDKLGDMAIFYLKYELEGFDIALSCDFLKEYGYDLAKPDLQIVGILVGLGFIDETTDTTKTAYKAVKEMKKIASEIGITVYALDKIWWLIGTETFYLHDNKKNTTESKRNEYIEYIKSFI